MSQIPFPLGSYPGRRTHESAGRLINAYAEPLGPGAVGAAKIVSAAGLLKFTEAVAIEGETLVPLTGYRGAILVGGTLFVAFSGVLVTVDEAGTVTMAGLLPNVTTGVFDPVRDRVQFSRNNHQPPPPDVVATTSNGNSYLCTTTSVTAFDVTPPGMTEITNVFMDGYTFYADASGLIQASQINDADSFDALDVTRAQAKAGQLRRLIAYDQHLFAMCETWIEVYRNTANPAGFPFSRVAVINRGLIATYAVAGFQDGFGKALVWVGDDNGIHILDGYTVTRISTPDVDRHIEELEDKSSIEAQAYITSGAAFVVVSSPEWTWEFNLTTQQWNERRSRLKSGALLDRWRGTGDSVFAFGKWLVGDTHSGKLHEITSDARKEDDAPLVMRIESAPVHDFPRGLSVPRADFNWAPGTGRAPGDDPIETDPQVQVSWSDDGGLHWSNPLWRSLGRQDANPAITILRTGRTAAQGRRWGLEISDPVYAALLGGDMTVERQVG
jgi:hypothetical protein